MSSQQPQKKINAAEKRARPKQPDHGELTANTRPIPARAAEKTVLKAMTGDNSYRRVTSAVWTLSALLEDGKTPQAERAFDLLMEEAARIEQPVSKMDAVYLLWRVTWPFPSDLRARALGELLAACHAANSWKAGRTMRDVAAVIAAEDRHKAQQIIASMRDSVYKRHAQRRLDAG